MRINRTRAKLAAACVAAASLAGGVLAQPGSAAPQLSCHGHVGIGEQTHEIDDNGLVYRFGCNDTINGFSVIAPGELITYSPTAAAVGPDDSDTTVSGNKEFECAGDIPGFAHNCSRGIAKAGYALRGEVGTDNAPCTDVGGTGHWMLIVINSEGTPSGPFDMGRTRGCPKPKKAKAQKKAQRKSTSKAAATRH